MKENVSRQAELASIASLEKKRKVKDEEFKIPLPKQVCRGPSWDWSKEPNKIGRDEFVKEGESDPESVNSNSIQSNSDSFMSIDAEAKTDPDCPEIPESEDPWTSSASWAGTSSGTCHYSSVNKASMDKRTSERESNSSKEQYDCPEHHYGKHVMEYEQADIKNYKNKELDDLLYSDGVDPGTSYILSSGRWSVNQDADAQQEGKKKITIDKEFEQYFSMLML